MRFSTLLILLIIISTTLLVSQENDDCLMCHDDHEMTMEKGRRTISLWVNSSKFNTSAHKGVKCVSCHKGFNPEDIPHKEVITPVDCKGCHTDVEKKHTFHPWMSSAPLKDDCKNCHEHHYTSPVRGSKSNFSGVNTVEKCGTCHKDVKQEFMKSEHFKTLSHSSSEFSPDCNYCHRNPITKGWISNYKERKDNQNNVCIDCHKSDSHNPEVLKKISNSESRHAKLRLSGKEHAAVCTDCHGFHNIVKNEDFEAKLSVKNSFNTCGKCHVHIAQEYQNSIHGLLQMKGNMNAAGCVSCHFEHSQDKKENISDDIYAFNKLNKEFSEKSLMTNCISCHTSDNKSLAESHKFLPYLESHFASVTCYDCHSSYSKPHLSHNILPIEKSRRDCQECHEQTLELKSVLFKYEKTKSVESEGVVKGNISARTNTVGLTNNIILDYLSLIIMGGIVLGLLIHAYVRWYFKKKEIK